MGIKAKVKQLARDFGLRYNPRDYRFAAFPKEDIIIRNFLADCPDPAYRKYRNNLAKFLNSPDFKREMKREQGCMINRSSLRYEMKIIRKIRYKGLRERCLLLYGKIEMKMADAKSLALIHETERPKVQEEILLHEFAHELLNADRIRLKTWKWDEGLATYMASRALGNPGRFRKRLRAGNKMLDAYFEYAHKWHHLLKKARTPQERKKIIMSKCRR